MADDLDQMYEDNEVSPYDEDDTMSPLQMMMQGAYGTVTPEGKAKASEIFGNLYDHRSEYDNSEQKAYQDYEAQAQAAREVLRKARDVLAAKKTPSTKWLEMAAGFGSPTRTGAFGESLGNYAKARIPGRQQETAWEQNRDSQVLGFDTGMSSIDQQLALQRLALQQKRRGADDKLMIEAMKIMGKPTPMRTTPQQNQERDLNRAYLKDYVEFMQTGAPNAAADISALKAAQGALTGVHTDPKTGLPVQGKPSDTLSGPIVGLVPKIVRDLILPKSSETQENVESVAQKSMRVIMGPQFTEGEGLRLLARVYNPRFEEGVNAKRVGRLLRQLQIGYNEKVRAARYFEDHHHSLAGYKGRKVWTLSMFDPDVPEGQSPLDAMAKEAESILDMGGDQGATPQGGPPAPDEGQEEIDIESLMPAHAKGGKVRKYAEGGIVEGNFPDGRPRFRMPDNKVIKGRPGMTYEQVLEIYTNATGTAPTRPGLPPQQIPSRDDVPQDEPRPAIPPQEQALPAEEPLGDTLDNPVAAGATGAGIAVGTDVADRLIDRVVPGRRINNPQRRVIDMMSERNLSPQQLATEVRKMQASGIPGMAMDAGPPAVRAMANDALTGSGGPQATEALRRIRDRQEQAPTRTMDQINSGLAPDEYFDELDKLKDKLYTQAAPLYEAAYKAHPAVPSKVLGDILSTPDGKVAVKNALRLMRNSGKKIGKADAVGMIRSPSLEFLDNVKRGFDQLISKEEGAGASHQSTPLGKSLRDLRGRLVTELDTATAGKKGGSLYAKARAQYSGDLEVLEALKLGREDFIKMQPPEVKRLVDKMSFAEKDALRTGVAQKLFEQIEAPSGEVNAARKVIGSPAMRKRLELIFDSPKKFELFETTLQKEMELYEASKSSMAAGEQGLARHVGKQPTMFQRLVSKVPRLGIGSPTMWGLQFARNMTSKDEKKLEEVIRLLKSSTPDELQDLEKFEGKFNRRVGRRGRTGKAALAGAAIGAGAAGVNMLMGDDDEDGDAE